MSTCNELWGRLEKLSHLPTVILGIGNSLKGDDCAGPAVCQRIKGKVAAEVIDAQTVPENYIRPIIKNSPEFLLVIDAVDFEAEPGTIRLLDPESLSSLTLSTHVPSPRLFVDMLRQEIPLGVYFIGIQPGQTDFGQSPSSAVAEAIEILAAGLIRIFPASAEQAN